MSEVAPERLVPLTLVPVEVFGEDDCCVHGTAADSVECPSTGYGLSDAVSSWSDCNRAGGRIYRVEDLPGRRDPGDTVTVWAAPDDLPWFERRFGDDPDNCTRVAVPRELAEVLADYSPRLCGVCLGISPSRDGHDRNPPCVGHAREVLRRTLGLDAPPDAPAVSPSAT